MNINSTLHLAAAAALCAALLGPAVADGVPAAPFVFAEKGRPRAAVVVDKNASKITRYAADELADYLGKISGARFAVVDAPTPGFASIYVGRPYKAKAEDEIHVEVKSPTELEVNGAQPRGPLYAVYDLLETLGCGFYSRDYEKIPSVTNTLSIVGDYSKTDAPWMFWRSLAVPSANDLRYELKLRMNAGNGRLDQVFGDVSRHGDINQDLPGKWLRRRETFKTNPEWYGLDKASGKRVETAVCVANEEMYRFLRDSVEKQLKEKYPGNPEISLGVDDGCTICQCDKCLALADSDDNGVRNFAIPQIVLANRLAKDLAPRYPKLRINILVYNSVGTPPHDLEKFKLDPHVGLAHAVLWRNHGRPIDSWPLGFWVLHEWVPYSSLPSYTWDYYANFKSFFIPFPNIDTIWENARIYKDINLRGQAPQVLYNFQGDMADLHYWLLGKFWWNPDHDGPALVKEWCEGVYGPAAPYVLDYLEVIHHGRDRQISPWIGCYVASTEHFLTGEDCVRIYNVFSKARTAVRQGSYYTPAFDGQEAWAREAQVVRASISPLINCLLRYDDMAHAAPKMRVKLPSREKMREDILIAMNGDSRSRYGRMEGGEGSHPMQLIGFAMAGDTNITVRPDRTGASFNVPASELTGGKKMSRQKDPDGTDFVRFSVKLSGEPEGIWMNPGYAESGWTVPKEREGDWYVFARVRVGATVPLDPESAYLGIYSPWIVNGVVRSSLEEIANMPFAGTTTNITNADGMVLQGIDNWRTLCLGRYHLVPGARIWLMPGQHSPTRFHDMAWVALVDPSLVEGPVPAKPAAGVAPRSLHLKAVDFARKQPGEVTNLLDRIDNYRYLRVDATNRIEIPFAVAQKGRFDVCVRVRVGASVPLDQKAAFVSLVRRVADGEDEVLASERVTGSIGADAWQTICLETRDIDENVRLVFEPGTAHPPKFLDVRDVSLLTPDVLSKTLAPLK